MTAISESENISSEIQANSKSQLKELPELESSLSQAWEQANGNKKAPLEISPIAINALNGITQFSNMLKGLPRSGFNIEESFAGEKIISPLPSSDGTVGTNYSNSSKAA